MKGINLECDNINNDGLMCLTVASMGKAQEQKVKFEQEQEQSGQQIQTKKRREGGGKCSRLKTSRSV